MNAFWEVVASNAIVATILAIGSMLLGRIWRNAAAVHVLWVVVLLKLFTPPLVTAELTLPYTVLPTAASSGPHEVTLNSPAQKAADQSDFVAKTNAQGGIAAGNPESTSRESRLSPGPPSSEVMVLSS